MHAPTFFRDIVRRNYDALMTNPTDLGALWNAVLSMNTLAEFVALHRLGYPLLTRKELDEKAKTIREEFTILETLKQCAETLKHVRKLNNDTYYPEFYESYVRSAITRQRAA